MKSKAFKKKLSERHRSKVWATDLARSLVLALVLLVGVCLLGTGGYIYFEGWNLREAFYMTAITLSTVGFGEVHPLSPTGQLFSAGLIILGVVATAYSFSLVGRILLEGELNRFRGIHKMNKKIAAIKNHFIVCGYGRLANFVIPDLIERGEDLVVIENDREVIADLTTLGIPYIEGNAYDEDTLLAAGIERAQALLALLPKDPYNVYVTLVARNLNKTLRIVSRTESDESENKLRLAGANQVVSPYRVSGSRIVQQLLNPNVNDFLQILCDESSGEQLVLEQTLIPEGSPLVGQSLHDASLRNKVGVTVAAYIDPAGKPNLTPQASDVIKAGTMMIVLGTGASIQKFSGLIEP
ncbi:potassium channel protein [Oligoflexia bacterium]|nr:potassium channel protein [Oligoflexia bacterium]